MLYSLRYTHALSRSCGLARRCKKFGFEERVHAQRFFALFSPSPRFPVLRFGTHVDLMELLCCNGGFNRKLPSSSVIRDLRSSTVLSYPISAPIFSLHTYPVAPTLMLALTAIGGKIGCRHPEKLTLEKSRPPTALFTLSAGSSPLTSFFRLT